MSTMLSLRKTGLNKNKNYEEFLLWLSGNEPD